MFHDRHAQNIFSGNTDDFKDTFSREPKDRRHVVKSLIDL